MELEVGRTYYMVTFADTEQSMPGIKPLIFIGTNVLEAENQSHDLYCFQDTVSYQRFGEFTEATEVKECCVHQFAPENIGTSLVDIYRVQTIVESSAEKYRRLGEPKLAVLEDGWVTIDGVNK